MSVFSSLRQLIKVRLTGQVQNILLNFSPARNSKADTKVKWIRPAKIPSYLPEKSGDLSHFQMPDPQSVRKYFDANEKLKNCTNENVRKLFTMGYQNEYANQEGYKENLIAKVKAHKYDFKSDEVKIAKLTAEIRLKQYLLAVGKKKSNRTKTNELIHKRRKKLVQLRQSDYKKFEWLLEKLDLVYKPDPIVAEVVCRKKSVKLLANLKKQKLKELKLAEYKKRLDEMKVPYLEKKLKKLLWIKEQETSLQLTPSVTESDIEECRKEIETVKLEVEERCKKGYLRKVHPYTLELYEPEGFPSKIYTNLEEIEDIKGGIQQRGCPMQDWLNKANGKDGNNETR